MKYKGTTKERLDRIEQMVRDGFKSLIKIGEEEMFDIKRMLADATANRDAFSAYKNMTDAMIAELKAAAGDPAEFDAALKLFEENTAAMAAAAVSGTPAEPPAGASVGGATKND